MADELGRAIRNAVTRQDGAYAYGYDDAGVRFGDEADGRTFLNTQSWGLMSSRAAGDTDDASAAGCGQAIRALSTPWGPRLLDPAFRGCDPQIGRVSLPDHAKGEVPQQLPLYQPNSYFYELGHPQCGGDACQRASALRGGRNRLGEGNTT